MNNPPGHGAATRLLTRAELKAIGMPRKSDRFPPLAPPDVSNGHEGNAGCLVVTLLAVAVASLIFMAAWKGLGLW